MFRKSIEAIIAQGVSDLEALVQQTRKASDEASAKVSQCQSEIQTLVNLAKQVPEKVFDRYSNVLVGTIEEYSDSSQLYAILQLCSSSANLHGLMGDEKIQKGKYRVIVLLEKLS